MPRKLRLLRIEHVAVVVMGLFVVLALRLVDLQVIRHAQFRARQLRQVDARLQVPARRGRILDREGRVLAFDVLAYDISVVKRRVRSKDLDILAEAAGMKKRALKAALRGADKFVVLRRQATLSPEAARRLASLPGVCLERRTYRQYPFGTLGAQVIGFVDQEGNGAEGVEKAYDDVLRGTPGEVVQLRDEDGEAIGTLSARDPIDGDDLVLALDLDLQRIADDELQRALGETGSRGGSVLILDPATGDILASASAPLPARRDGAYVAATWRNRAVYDLFEPGSTLKPVTAIAGLRRGVITPTTYLYAERGVHSFGRAGVIRDAHPEQGDGWLTFEQAFARSSNICFAKLARELDSNQLYDELRSCGFGSRSGVDLPSEPNGWLSLPRDWSGRTRLCLGYGQEISVTALQLANLYVTIANGGSLLRPRMALGIEHADGGREEFASREVRRVLSADLAATLRALCTRVVVEGTGKRAGLDGVQVAGKTGTAQKAEDGRYVARYVASFGGFVPAESPRLVGLVVLDEPRGHHHWGGYSAAATFRRIMESVTQSTRYLAPAPGRITVVRADDLRPGQDRNESPPNLAGMSGVALPEWRRRRH